VDRSGDGGGGLTAQAAQSAEYKQVTVLFADVVGYHGVSFSVPVPFS
jgi:class 3 adenylate cyclase